MAESKENPLLIKEKAFTVGLQVTLHPLALLSISDYITRHRLREQSGPIVGVLLGQNEGRNLSIEVAFEVVAEINEHGYQVNAGALNKRLEQMKEVYSKPQLDLVGWFTPTPDSGPQPEMLSLHSSMVALNESAVLLAFHPSQILEKNTAGGKLPISIYETIWDSEALAAEQAAGKETESGTSPKFKFRELTYSVESVDAEMVAVDNVAKAVGSAAAPKTEDAAASEASKGKASDGSTSAEKKAEEVELSPEEEEMIVFLSAKLNAVRMLRSRIALMSTYLKSLPESYNTGEIYSSGDPSVNFQLLREIQALTNRIPLLLPFEKEKFDTELLSEKNDVNLLTMLSVITKSMKDARELNRKYGILAPTFSRAGVKAVASKMQRQYREGMDSEAYFDADSAQLSLGQDISRTDSGFGDRDESMGNAD